MSSELRVDVQKSSVPVLWLDTSVIISISRVRNGKSENRAEWVRWLDQEIYKAVRACRVICPEANQDCENLRAPRAFSDAIVPLSLGIRTRRPYEIRFIQERLAMQAFLGGSSTLAFAFHNAFHGDPVAKLMELNSQPFIIDVIETFSPEKVERISKSRKEVASKLEALRQANLRAGVSYHQQIAREFDGEVEAMLFDAMRFTQLQMSGQECSLDDWGRAQPLNRLVAAWRHINEGDGDLVRFAEFLKSAHFQSVPERSIAVRLMSALLTGDAPVRSGDAMDIEHVSAYLPYVDLMILDRRMSERVNRHGLTKEYGTQCCYIGDQEILTSWFEKLR